MKYTNKFNLPQSFVDLIQEITYDPTLADPNRIGTTMLIGAPRVRLLVLRHWNDIVEDVSNHIWRITGNAYHYILSKTKKDGRLIEEKFTEVIDGIEVVSKIDLYEKSSQSLEDYKFTSVWQVKLGDKKDWTNQLNVYAWMFRKKNIPVKKLQVNAILKDWSEMERRQHQDYPPVPFKSVPIKLWSFTEQNDYVEERILIHKEASNLEDNDLPICTPAERWKKEDIWAVHQGTAKKATRLFKTEEEAKKFIKKEKKLKSPIIQFRRGEDKKCKICNANKFCSYYKEIYGI